MRPPSARRRRLISPSRHLHCPRLPHPRLPHRHRRLRQASSATLRIAPELMRPPRGPGARTLTVLPKRIAASIVAVIALVASVLAAAQPASLAGSAAPAAVPPLTARVTDLTGTLSQGEQQALDAKLAAWE